MKSTTNGTGRKKSYGCDLEKEEKLDWSYTQRRKPSEVGDRGSDDRKKTKGKETIGYAERISERIVVCGTKEKGRKQKRVENMEAKNLPHGRTLTTIKRCLTGNYYQRIHEYLVVHCPQTPSGSLSRVAREPDR